ncbi:hypothetical protein [Pyxidicoccus trucidator]|uniref:hypothetical protein n=1 Tax=Pyxidicoccus trucidator TaxID=2709662 RepID=UPI0013DCF908|nr:hypothetical protein [Pyxidicoccus trucidator]
MTKNILKTALVVLGAGSLMTGCDFEQPEAPCFVQDATNWYAKYDVVQEPRLADGTACTFSPGIGERLGVYKFVDPDNRAEPLITIRPTGLTALAGRDSGDPARQTALGRLSAEPDAEEFCSGTGFSVATVDAAATATAAATSVTYEFSNVRVYSAPSAPGTQLTGELKYTRDGCTSTYVIRALWPAEGCIMGADRGSDPANACGNGSGLNPDFDATCVAIANCGSLNPDHDGCCVPAKPIPSFVASED